MPSLTTYLKKPWVVMPIVAALAFGGWFTLLRPDDGATADQAGTATEQVVEATVGTMSKTVSADGTVAASDTDDLSFGSAGTVTAVNVEAGDAVKAGQVLAEIDSASLQADVSSAEASLADAEAKLADDEGAGASDEQLTADESSIQSAQDQLDAATEALAGAKLVASFDGTVASVNVTVGEELSSGGTGGTGMTGSASGSGNSSSTLGSGSQLPTGSDSGDSDGSSGAEISVITTGRFTVDLGFDDTDIANVKVGQVASVSISTSSSSSGRFPGGGSLPFGFPGGASVSGGAAGASGDQGGSTTTTTAPATADDGGTPGIVTEVGTVADASSGVASYPVTVAFKDASGDFNVGASVTVAITYAEVEGAVQIPAFAVTTTNGTSTVKVKAASGTETRTITTGLTSGTMVQVTSGLKAGESVVIAFPGRSTGTNGGAGAGAGGNAGGGEGAPGGPPSGAFPGGLGGGS